MSHPAPGSPEPRSARETNTDTQARLEAMRRQQQRRGRRGPVLAGVLGALLILGLVLGGIALVRSRDDGAPAAGPGAPLGQVASYGNLARDHITSGYSYPQEPPVGGAHNPAWANCGIYDKAVPPQYAVHSLEHGAVWITYTKALPKAQVDRLKQKVQQQGNGYMLMSVNEKQTAPLVLTSWGKQLRLGSLDEAKVDSFVRSYLQNPQLTPEPGAPCSGGYDPNAA